MNRVLALLIVLTGFVLPSDAPACHRCGIFGARCRFAVKHVPYVAPVAYTPPAYNTTFNFVNSYPVPYLAQGSSVYGFSLAASPYSLDEALILDRSARLTEVFANSAASALGGHQATIQGALALSAANDQRTKDAAVALAYFGSQGAPAPQQTLSFKATVGNDGRMSIQQVPLQGQGCPDGCVPDPNLSPAAPQTLSLNSGPVSLAACARCHDGRGTGKAPVEIVISEEFGIHPDFLERSEIAIKSGKMPPNSNLSRAARSKLVARLDELAERKQ